MRAGLAAFALISVLCAAAALSLSGCSRSKVQASPDTPVITVGNRVITLKEYTEALGRLLPEDSSDISPDELKGLKDELVNEIIEEELLLEEAKNLGIAVTDEEVSTEVGRIKSASEGDSLKEAVAGRYGSVEEWEKEIRKKLVIRKTVQKAVEVRIHITDEAVRSYYDSHIKEFQVSERVRARMIVLSNLEEAERLKKRLTPQNFEESARSKSLGPERARGGDLGFFSRGEMPREFEDEVFGLRKGEISSIVKTEYGFHIFLVEERSRPGRLKFSEVSDRIRDRLRQEATEEEFGRLMAYLKENSRIEIREELL